MSRAVDKAYRAIREAILTGQFRPGNHLKEEFLAGMTGTSRTPVREALRRLSAESIVEFVPNQGAFVASWSVDEISEIFQLRALLEGHAAERAAVLASAEELARLGRLADEMLELAETRSAPALQRITVANSEFHRVILEAARSPRLAGLMGQVVEVPLVLRTFQRYAPEALRRSLAHHREIVDALLARDGQWAASVMRSHIHAARHAFDPATDADTPRSAAE